MHLVLAYIVLPTLFCAYVLGVSIYFILKIVYRRKPGYISENDILLSPIKLYSSFRERYYGGIRICVVDRILCLGIKPLTVWSVDDGLIPLKWFITWYFMSITLFTLIFGSIFVILVNQIPSD
jgi:hypothetical protein